jgi:hypothetical protein
MFFSRKEERYAGRHDMIVWGVLVIVVCSVTGAPVKRNSVVNSAAHVAEAYFSNLWAGESDALQGPDVWPEHSRQNLSRDTADTLVYQPADGTWNARFIQYPGDYMMMAYQMPADGYVTGVNVPVYEWGTGDQELTMSIHKLAYPTGQRDCGDPGSHQQSGYHPRWGR